MYHALTDLTVIVHLAFIVFAVGGGLLARRRRWLMPVHGAALAWAVYAECSSGIICPLTSVENFFAERAGMTSYSGDFVTHYLVPVIYQEDLPQKWQEIAALAVVVFNGFIYASVPWSRRRGGKGEPGRSANV
jgi:hypothetical protein